MTESRSRALAVLVCLAAALVLTAPGVLGGRDLYVGDVGHFEQPRDELVAPRLRAGLGLPRWLPGVYGGAPALGGQELALLYPPNDLLLLAVPERARIWGLALHLLLAALGARALARRLGAGESAALVSGLVFGFGGAAVSMSAVPVYARTAGWLPWAVLGIVRASAGERRGLALATLALLGTYLGGDPLGCAWAGVAGLAVALVAGDRPLAQRSRAALGAVLGAALLTAVLGAAQLVPAALATTESVRAGGMTYEGATQFSLWPPELVGLLVPFAFGAQAAPETAWLEAARHGHRAWSEVLYVGPIALGLAALAFFPRGKSARRPLGDPLVRAGLVVLLLFLPLALGDSTWLSARLYRIFFALPGAGLFRYPAKLFLQASLGISLLAGAGAQALASDSPSGKLRPSFLYLLGALGALALVASNAVRLGSETFAGWIDSLGSQELSGKLAAEALAWRLAHVAFVAFGGAALVARRRVSSRRLGLALALVVAVDLALGCRSGVILGPREAILRPPAAAALLAEQARKDGFPARVYPTFAGREETPEDQEAAARTGILPSEGLLPNTGIAQGVLSQHGFLSNAPLRQLVVGEQVDALRRAGKLSAAQGAALRGARYVLARQDEVADYSSEAKVVGPLPGGRALLALANAPPWAAVYARARFAPGIQGGLEALRSKDPRREVVLEGVSPDPSLESSGEDASVPLARIRLVGTFEPERFELEVDSPVRGWLVVREAYARGWSALVAGEPRAISPADVAFRAVGLPQGTSRVVFTYEAPGERLGWLVSLVGVLGCGGVFWRGKVALQKRLK